MPSYLSACLRTHSLFYPPSRPACLPICSSLPIFLPAYLIGVISCPPTHLSNTLSPFLPTCSQLVTFFPTFIQFFHSCLLVWPPGLSVSLPNNLPHPHSRSFVASLSRYYPRQLPTPLTYPPHHLPIVISTSLSTSYSLSHLPTCSPSSPQSYHLPAYLPSMATFSTYTSQCPSTCPPISLLTQS